ncbi:hypothetical protein QBZ16_003319 [Prototheca wickerhamii]|uniref:Uncharacterized protein n=1 Tax=Prototheca wickerhamii TaxID=3111 RepID=A0AAD9MHF3_PROWI|nr:hypothetical protein QBZ16_003319 [Prototheca wickerhamii]
MTAVDFVAATSAGPVVPEQAMLRWDSEASPVGTAVFAAAAAEGSGLSVTVKSSAVAPLVPNGPASLSLVLGDAGVAKGADVLLARSVHLATATPREELLPARRERPDVHHTFRQPEKRVNALALTVTMALLAVFWLRLTLTQTLVPLAALLSVVSFTGRGLGPAKAKSL